MCWKFALMYNLVPKIGICCKNLRLQESFIQKKVLRNIGSDPDLKFPEKTEPDLDPEQIVSDPQHCSLSRKFRLFVAKVAKSANSCK
jgi:hypothetical protein